MKTNGAPTRAAFGPRVELNHCPDLFAPQLVKNFVAPPSAIDNLRISSTDTISLPGLGETEVHLDGWLRIARSRPTTDSWEEAEVQTNLLDMYLRGDSERLGPVIVTLQSGVLSAGVIRNPLGNETGNRPEKACQMAVSVEFDLPRQGLLLFNREPIDLTIENVRAIPPLDSVGRGKIHFVLPLFSRTDPDGEPAAYLTNLEFRMGGYLERRPEGA